MRMTIMRRKAKSGGVAFDFSIVAPIEQTRPLVLTNSFNDPSGAASKDVNEVGRAGQACVRSRSLCKQYPYSIFMWATLIPLCYAMLPLPLSHITGVRTGGEDGSQRRQLQSHSPAGVSAQAPLERLGGK